MKREDFNNVRLEVIKLLERMQDGYTKREVDRVEEYTQELFIQSDDMIICGTSDGEWCLGYEASKELIENDWKYWGNVIIDTENVEVSLKDDVAWFNTTGSVEQSFKNDDETCDRFVGFVKEYLEEECWLGKLSDQAKLTTVNWLLTHFNLDESASERRYRWKIRLSGVAIKIDGRWKFTQMQFSLPTTSLYPDERIWEGNCYEGWHQKGFEKLREFVNTKKENQFLEIISALTSFNNDYFNKDQTSVQFVNKYFFNCDDIKLIGTGTDNYTGVEGLINAVELHRSQWESLRFGIAESIISVNGDTAWLITQGEVNTTIKYQDAMKMEIEKANRIIESKLTSREKLFKIHRNIATMMNEASKGESYQWPIRFEAVLVRENNQWLFHTVQFSYPCNMILEGKTDAATTIK